MEEKVFINEYVSTTPATVRITDTNTLVEPMSEKIKKLDKDMDDLDYKIKDLYTSTATKDDIKSVYEKIEEFDKYIGALDYEIQDLYTSKEITINDIIRLYDLREKLEYKVHNLEKQTDQLSKWIIFNMIISFLSVSISIAILYIIGQM